MEKIEYKAGLIVKSPKVLGNTVEIDASRMGKVELANDFRLSFDRSKLVIDIRRGGDFEDSALYLSAYYDWVLCADSSGATCLVPLKKECK